MNNRTFLESFILPMFFFLNFFLTTFRPADRAEVHHEGHDPAAPDRSPAVLCHPHVRHHRSGVLQREASPHLSAIGRNLR